MKRVRGQRAAGERPVRPGVPPRSVGRGLDDQHHGPLAEHEPIAIGIEGTARALGLLVALRHRAHVREPGKHGLGDPGIGAAGDDHLRLAGQDEPPGFEQGRVAARAGQRARGDRPVHAEVDGDLAGGHVGDRRGHVERAHRSRAGGQQRPHVGLGLGHAGHRGVDHDADLVRGSLDLEAGVSDGFARGDDRELRDSSRSPGALAAQLGLGVEVPDFAGDPDRQPRGVERLDRTDSRVSVDEPSPGAGHIEPERGQRSDPGDDRVGTASLGTHADGRGSAGRVTRPTLSPAGHERLGL